ncbi:hypothetical protein GCM10009678_14610 [Actinomadura kijaniata]
MPLGRSTLSGILASRRLPRRKVLVSFLTTCQVPVDQHRPWLRAWDRLALTHTRQPSAALAEELRLQVAQLLVEGRQAVPPRRRVHAPGAATRLTRPARRRPETHLHLLQQDHCPTKRPVT